MNYLKQFLKGNKRLVSGATLVVSIQSLLMLYLPYLIAVMINEGIMKNNTTLIFSSGFKMLGVLLLETIFGLYSCYLAAVLASRFGKESREKMFRKVQGLRVDEVNSLGVASLVTRMGIDNVTVQQMIVAFFQMILPGPMIGLLGIYMTYRLSPELTFIPLVIVVIYIVILGVILTKSVPYIQDVQIRLDRMTKVFREFLMGVKIIRSFNKSKEEQKRANEAFGLYTENNIRINLLFSVLSPLAYTLLLFAIAGVLWFGSILVAQEMIGIGDVSAVIEYTTMSIGMLIMSSMVLFQLPKAKASLNRIEEVLLKNETLIEVSNSPETIDGELTYQDIVVFDNVSMAYGADEQLAIEKINLTFRRGETTAIVGATGAGKTSIIKTLLRLNEKNEGRLTINGIEIEDMSLKKLRDLISYVPQRNFLFRGTIQENISFNEDTGDFNSVVEAAKVSQAYEFISQMPLGFETMVSQGGSNFSGGQKQRLALARALFKQADIYIFDDSFSALDAATDAKVRVGIQQVLDQAAVVIIAQRLQSIVTVDKIIVMDKGRIVGEGSHQQLLKDNRQYRLIAKSQGLLIEEGEDV